jgi:uncharacterized membrane protein YkvA (DUF1232 family)
VSTLLTIVLVLAALYGLLLLAIAVTSGRTRELLRFAPDCAVLFARLARDPTSSRAVRWTTLVVAGYLAMPFDLVPDFIPVAGQLDDAVVVVLGLRAILRSSGPELLHEHWPGPDSSLDVVLRLVGMPRAHRPVRGVARRR